MSLPSPQYPLGDACSALFNNTLYSYNSQAFQSLQLHQGAQWAELPMGVAVTGGVCVMSTPKENTTEAALFIVGGTSNKSDYQGFQRYRFADGIWETLQPQVAVTQNRLYHSAVYLNASDSILVYAGTQDGTQQLSSQTFTIQASSPYLVTAYQAIAPPAIKPLLLPWTESSAIYLGGSVTNKQAMVFSPSTTWVDSNATLAEPFYNTSNIKGIVINGDDGSRNLYTFDMTTSPNSVNRTVLLDGDGNPVQKSPAILSRRDLDERPFDEAEERSVMLEKRGNLTIADWPAYNGTYAPSSTRTTFSVCRDQSGLVMISGGNEEDVLCMFKARDNCWVNATSKLVAHGKVSAVGGLGTATTSTASIASATASSSSSAIADSAAIPAFPVKILGAVLGSIVAVALILLGVLLLLRWSKKRRHYSDAGHQRRSSGIPDEKDGLDFADRGLPQMSSARQFRNHEPQGSRGSFSSMAILMGRVGGHKRGGENGNGSLGSDSSSHFNKKYKSAISKPIPQEQPSAFASPTRDQKAPALDDEKASPPSRQRGNSRGGRRGSTRRSSGWDRYWSGGSAMNILGFGGSKRTTYEGSDRSSGSRYSDYRLPSQVTQSSATVPPLKIGQRAELNRVASGSPTIANSSSKFPLTREMSGTIERHGSVSSLSSSNDDRHDAFSSGVPASVHEQQGAWTPIDRQAGSIGRAYSNAYTESNYEKTLPRDTRFGGTPFPPPQRSPTKQRSDMSWLNLGGESRI